MQARRVCGCARRGSGVWILPRSRPAQQRTGVQGRPRPELQLAAMVDRAFAHRTTTCSGRDWNREGRKEMEAHNGFVGVRVLAGVGWLRVEVAIKVD